MRRFFMDAYKLYHNYQHQHEEVLKIADEVIKSFERKYGRPFVYPPCSNSITNLYALLEAGYGEALWPMLENVSYSYEHEIESILAFVSTIIRNHDTIKPYYPFVLRYYSMNHIQKVGEKYIFDTKVGTLTATLLTEYEKNRKALEYARRQSYYCFCHAATEGFVRENLEYQAITSLVPHQFGRKLYHSYVRSHGKILDFALGVCVEEENYNQIIKPIVLNEVYGYQLVEEEQKLSSDELGKEKSLLMRLAVAKQRRM